MKYSAVITDHFQHPRNTGALPECSAVGEAENPVCLDRLRLYLCIEPGDGTVTAASFQAEGCVPSMAAGSFLTEYVIGKKPAELRALTPELLEGELGGLPATKKHAAHLAVDALLDALGKITR